MCFVYVNALANWTCIKCYNSVIEKTEDRPNVHKTLWDQHGNYLNQPQAQVWKQNKIYELLAVKRIFVFYMSHSYLPLMKLREGNVFTSVCPSVCPHGGSPFDHYP